ncbi:bifunctional adenosylcobinamide kinase/adenosylcobinamide-phosphate guanylyltransferase [Trinickia dinghuensis]|uniref:Bifunctional adenosylcobalamin biosynthesis protein n=1 Tax=Trinickia dinghuensis TaxID=2291023 RepID=A0A3D8JUX1_9BURK|nr:bifunctional adenosylcobinamide kinase/adenosylcobinamide-phosphate guanylyltransferase [Trinickia dinghuensis]RDU96592.1 bifunctional adenosylcobinamide kinase/adenosylcobinamide-phosphate guanylyltransferase [Trinickia dinghuensis]
MRHPDLTFVLGGARSGKSRHAEQLAQTQASRLGLPVTYIATARDAGDAEFAARIAHHRARRPAQWGLVEAGADLAEAIAGTDDGRTCILVDCLTLWLANVICPANDEDGREGLQNDDCAARMDALETALSRVRGPVIVVSNEIGMGVVPMGAMTRRYVDELGRLNQRVAALAREVTLMVAGLPMTVKSEGTR